MNDWIDRLEDRTKQFAIRATRLCGGLEEVRGLRHVAWQLSDSAGSVAANHRAMRRARSGRERAAKLQTVNEEIDESALWLEIVDAILPKADAEVRWLLEEAVELRAIFAKAKSTLPRRLTKPPA